MTKHYTAEQIGQRVAELRKARGLSRKDLAAALGLAGESSVSEIENGRNNKKFVQFGEIADILGTTPNDLLGFEAMAPDDLDMMGAAIQVMLMEEGWPRERAEALVDIATEVATEKSELELDRRLAAAFRKRALRPQT